jgi:carbamoyl-phosphate synthase small subunit
VQNFTTGNVEIVSMNHGFAVDAASLPANARETHRSLFDGSNCGLEMTDRPAFSVQHHPDRPVRAAAIICLLASSR